MGMGIAGSDTPVIPSVRRTWDHSSSPMYSEMQKAASPAWSKVVQFRVCSIIPQWTSGAIGACGVETSIVSRGEPASWAFGGSAELGVSVSLTIGRAPASVDAAASWPVSETAPLSPEI